MTKQVDMEKIMSEILLNIRTEEFNVLQAKKINSSFTLNDKVREINIIVLKTISSNELLEALSNEVNKIIEEDNKIKFGIEFIKEETDNSNETEIGINKEDMNGYSATWDCPNNKGVITFENRELFNFAMKEIRKYKEYATNNFETDADYENLGSVSVEDYLTEYLNSDNNDKEAKKIVFNFLKKYMFMDLYVIEAIKSNMFFLLLVEDEDDNILHKICLGDICLDVTNAYEVVYEY